MRRHAISSTAFAFATGILFTSIPATAGSIESGTATASVVAPMKVTAERPLNFGDIESGDRQKIVIPASEKQAGAQGHSAKFRVEGSEYRVYQVFVQSDVVAVGQRTSHRLPVEEITVATRNSGAADRTGRLDGSGEDQIFVGGTILLTEEMPSDQYQADVVVQVSYM